ncbi:PleD family two-component system response regulator [Candidatus Neomarinimicrobiota bacterium]
MIKKILIIADSKHSYIDSIQQVLEEQEFEILVAYSGVSGFNMARDIKPDLVLIDSALSGFNGYQICSLLKLDIKYEDIRIIIMTDKNDRKSRILVGSSEADGYLEKPIDFQMLIDRIRQLED